MATATKRALEKLRAHFLEGQDDSSPLDDPDKIAKQIIDSVDTQMVRTIGEAREDLETSLNMYTKVVEVFDANSDDKVEKIIKKWGCVLDDES